MTIMDFHKTLNHKIPSLLENLHSSVSKVSAVGMNSNDTKPIIDFVASP